MGRGVGDYSKKLITAEECIVESEKLIERLKKKYIRVLKCMYAYSMTYSDSYSGLLNSALSLIADFPYVISMLAAHG